MRPTVRPLPRSWRRSAPAALALAALTLIQAPAMSAPANPGGHCARLAQVRVPGARHQQAACLDELTTAGTIASDTPTRPTGQG
ncbi:hypothetical protein SVIOM74S_08680 [Streptomyces violarus]